MTHGKVAAGLIALSAVGWGCFKSFDKVDGAGGAGTGAAGPTTSAGGATSGGGQGGGGASACPDATPNDCGAVSFSQPFAGAGDVVVTDMLYLGQSIVLVGRLTGLMTLGLDGPQVQANGTEGFLLELNDAGQYIAHELVPEADAGSTLRVAVHNGSGNLAVAGNSTQPGGDCTGMRGVFVRRLAFMAPSSFDVVYAACQNASDSATVTVEDAAFSDLGWVAVAGSLDGTMAGEASAGVDGLVQNFDPMGTPSTPYLAGGSGDAVIRAIVENPIGSNQWLVAGDFGDQLRFAIPGTNLEETRTALGTRDLFVASYDTFVSNPQLELVSLGDAGGNHRLAGMDILRDITGMPTGDAVIAAQMRGPIVAGTQSIPAPTREAVLALTFGVPDGEPAGVQFTYRHHFVLNADDIEVDSVVARGSDFVVGGRAAGDIVLDLDTTTGLATITSNTCERDTYFIDLDPTMESWNEQRCGDSNEQLSALSGFTMGGYAGVVRVPDGSSIILAGDPYAGPDIFLLGVGP